MTYADWAATHASDVRGEGHGSDHLWHYEGTPSTASGYKCARCMQNFSHYYHEEPNIFKAMKSAGVPKTCPRIQVFPIRLEYATEEEIKRFATVREQVQREQLAKQLAGRARAPFDAADYGAPALNED